MAKKQVITLSQAIEAAGVTNTTFSAWRRGSAKRPALPTIKVGWFVYVEPATYTKWAKKNGVTICELPATRDLPRPGEVVPRSQAEDKPVAKKSGEVRGVSRVPASKKQRFGVA